MTEILLTRHAKSYVNVRDLAYGNEESPLNDEGIQQTKQLNATFKTEHNIVPEEYVRPVASSMYTRPQQTAELTGFRNIDTLPLINEAVITPDMITKDGIIAKHQAERWVPQELQDRADEFIDRIRSGELTYQIYFTHGFFIAAVKNRLALEHESKGEPSPYHFDEKRGYIPTLATISKVIV